MAATRPRPPVLVGELFDDPSIVHRILARESPHPTTLAGREFVESRRMLEAAAAADGPTPPWLRTDEAGRPVLGGVFRTTWADADARVEEADVIADHPTLAAAARALFDAEVVRPYFVYSNISTPMRRAVAHVDIPAFRGIDRHETPTWLLTTMASSGLFTRWQVDIATAVAWFYGGVGGGFTYWPNGPDGPELPHDAAWNTCIVGDNDHMPHRVEQIGDGAEPLFGLDATITLADDGTWVVDDDGVITDFDADEVRVSLSWKAQVFADDDAAARFDAHTDDLDLATVTEVFAHALAEDGVTVSGSVLDARFAEAVRANFAAGFG